MGCMQPPPGLCEVPQAQFLVLRLSHHGLCNLFRITWYPMTLTHHSFLDHCLLPQRETRRMSTTWTNILVRTLVASERTPKSSELFKGPGDGDDQLTQLKSTAGDMPRHVSIQALKRQDIISTLLFPFLSSGFFCVVPFSGRLSPSSDNIPPRLPTHL